MKLTLNNNLNTKSKYPAMSNDKCIFNSAISIYIKNIKCRSLSLRGPQPEFAAALFLTFFNFLIIYSGPTFLTREKKNQLIYNFTLFVSVNCTHLLSFLSVQSGWSQLKPWYSNKRQPPVTVALILTLTKVTSFTNK